MRTRILASLGLAGFVGSLSSLAFADGSAADGSVASGLRFIAMAIAIGMATLGAATGQGKAAAAALDGIARNPSSRGDVFQPLIIALAFMEMQAFLGLIIAFTIKG